MAKRNVIWTKTADLQFIGILEYWVNRNKSATYSKKLLDLVSKKTNQISKRPFIINPLNIKGLELLQWVILVSIIRLMNSKSSLWHFGIIV
jgi:hypothetical protein